MQLVLQHGVAINQQGVLLEIKELLLKFTWKNKVSRIVKMIFKKIKKGGVTLSQSN